MSKKDDLISETLEVQRDKDINLSWLGLEFRFVSFLLNVLVNNFSVMSGRSHRFLVITSTKFGR